MSTPQEWYMSVPPVTRAWLTAAVVSTLGTRFGLFNIMLLAFNPSLIWNNFQIWRIVGNFVFFGKPSFNWIIQLVMLSRYGAALEDNPYPSGGGAHRGNIADFVTMLTFGGALLLVVATLLPGMMFMASSLSFMVIYVWSKRYPGTEVTFYFFRMPGVYLPWALIAWSICTGDDPTMDLFGMAAGHLYYFLVDALPNSPGAMAGKKWLWTPNFVYRIFGVAPTHAPAAYARGLTPQQQQRHAWGEGRRLVD